MLDRVGGGYSQQRSGALLTPHVQTRTHGSYGRAGAAAGASSSAGGASSSEAQAGAADDISPAAIEALTGMGFSREQAIAALRRYPAQPMPNPALITEARAPSPKRDADTRACLVQGDSHSTSKSSEP